MLAGRGLRAGAKPVCGEAVGLGLGWVEPREGGGALFLLVLGWARVTEPEGQVERAGSAKGGPMDWDGPALLG